MDKSAAFVYAMRTAERVTEDKIVDDRSLDGSNSHFNVSHYARIQKRIYHNTYIDHPLKNAKFVALDTGNIYIVKYVVKCWDCGFYLALHFESENGCYYGRLIAWENINSLHPLVSEMIAENHKKYELK